MNKETNEYTPKKIVDEEIIYTIPIYQRLFEWDGEMIQLLLDNLWEQYQKTSGKEQYYIGMLTLYENCNSHDLVDGQQRFSVLSIIASVFQFYYEKWALYKGKLHFKAREKDEQCLLNLFDTSKDYRALKENIPMGASMRKITKGRDVVLDWCNEEQHKAEIEKFAEYVYNYCTFFIAKLPKEYSATDLNKYFEAMNSTGRNLEGHEIIKVSSYLKSMQSEQDYYTKLWNLVSDMDKQMIRYKTEGKKRETEEAYKKRFEQAIYDHEWECVNDFNENNCNNEYQTIRQIKSEPKKLDTHFRWQRYEGEGYHSMLSFSEFLLQVLFLSLSEKIQYSVSVNEFFDTHNLLQTFKTYTSDWKEKDWKEFGNDLFRYRLIYDYFVIRIPNSEFAQFDLIYNNGYGDTESSVLRQFQAMLYSDSSSKTYYLWLAPYLKYINGLESKDQVSPVSLFECLQRNDNDRHPKDDWAKELNFNNPRLMYWFRRLDFYLWMDNHHKPSNQSDDVITNYRFRRGGRSIEHLHPQHDGEGTQYDDWGESKHRFGNLALISSSFNSTQSDDSINTKFGRIEDQINAKQIESIKLYLIHNSCKAKGNIAQWTLEEMEEHERQMFEVLDKSYE